MAPHTSHAARFGMDAASLAARRELLGLGEPERRWMLAEVPWARRVAPAVAREFYERQLESPEIRAFLEQRARATGDSFESLLGRLHASQERYFLDLFEAARDGWDLAYFERRLRIGAVHDEIDLPPKWYLVGYASYLAITRRLLARRWVLPRRRRRIEATLQKLFLLDIQAVMDSYLLSLFRSMGVRLEGRDAGRGRDLTEHMGGLKREVASALAALVEGARALHGTTAELTGEGKRLARVSQEVSGVAEELSRGHEGVAQRARSARVAADEGVRTSRECARILTALEQGAGEVAELLHAIRDVARVEDMLAVNASVQAVRAGEAGSGFSVVAEEVRRQSGEVRRVTEGIEHELERLRDRSREIGGFIERVADAVKIVDEHGRATAEAVEGEGEAVDALERGAHEAQDAAAAVGRTTARLEDLAARMERLVEGFSD